jgi:hypothetical protein
MQRVMNIWLVCISGLLVVGSVFGVAHAAGVTYSTDTTVDLSSPDINLTIRADSVATSVAVNTGNVVVTLAAGDTFVITSATRNVGINGSGITSVSCSEARVAIATMQGPSSGSNTFTVTPQSNQCTVASADSGQNVNTPTGLANNILRTTPVVEVIQQEDEVQDQGREGEDEGDENDNVTENTTTEDTGDTGDNIPAEPVFSDASVPQTAEEIRSAIADVLRKIEVLRKEISQLQQSSPALGVPEACKDITFTAGLTIGMVNQDVQCLQILLNQSAHTQLAASGVGSPGNETNYFGALTTAAVGKFQLTYSIIQDTNDPAYGYVGPKTRTQLNTLLGR